MGQNGGVRMFGTTLTGDPTFGTSLKDGSGDALFDPIYGDNSVPELDLRGLTVTNSGDELQFKVDVSSLDNLANGPDATGAGAVDYVVRWIGPAVDSSTGLRNPIYYAAVEVASGGGVPTFFAGAARLLRDPRAEVPGRERARRFAPGEPVGLHLCQGQERQRADHEHRGSGRGNPDRGRRHLLR